MYIQPKQDKVYIIKTNPMDFGAPSGREGRRLLAPPPPDPSSDGRPLPRVALRDHIFVIEKGIRVLGYSRFRDQLTSTAYVIVGLVAGYDGPAITLGDSKMKILSTSTSKTDGTTWATVDVDSLSDDTKLAYQVYKEAQAKAAELRKDFEAMFRDEAGTELLRFGYNYGKLSVAVGEAPKVAALPKAPKQSLGSFLTSQGIGGHRI